MCDIKKLINVLYLSQSIYFLYFLKLINIMNNNADLDDNDNHNKRVFYRFNHLQHLLDDTQILFFLSNLFSYRESIRIIS